MFSANWLWGRRKPLRNRNTKQLSRRAFQPHLELLETRVVPSVIHHSDGFASTRQQHPPAPELRKRLWAPREGR